MILTPIFLLFLGLLALLGLVLPTGSLPAGVSSGFNSIVGYMYAINGFFPIDTLIFLAGLGAILQGIVLIWKLVMLVINYFRGR